MNYKWTNENNLLFRKLTLLYLKIVCSDTQLNQKIIAGNVIKTRVLYYAAMIMYVLSIVFYYNNTLQ